MFRLNRILSQLLTYLISSIIVANFTSNVFANNIDPSLAIVPQQQKLIDQEKINREIDDFKNWQQDKSRVKPATENSKIKYDKSCFAVDKIILEGNSIISEEVIAKITTKYLTNCITAENITEIISKISNLYKEKGYITTQIYIKKQNLNSKVLIFNVIEGKVEDLQFGKNNIGDKITAYFISPLAINDILNIRAVDQIAENLSHIPSYLYKTNIEAGSKPGLSRININGTRAKSFAISGEFDNLGQKYTGYNRYSIEGKLENPLKLGDNINLKYISTRGIANAGFLHSPFENLDSSKYSKSYIASWSMPIKWARVGVNYSYSNYLSTIDGQMQSFTSSGQMTSSSFFANTVIFRNKSLKTTLNSGLNLLSSKSYLNDAYSSVQSRNLSNVEFGISNSFFTNYGSLFDKITYIKGIGHFGSIKDKANTLYHAEYDAVKFYQIYQLKTSKIFNGKLPISLQSNIDGQYAWQDVYSQNQFTLGGFYSVRGFRNVNIFGSSGILARNDIDFTLADYLKPSNILHKAITNNGKGGLTFGAFFDIGTIRSQLSTNTTSSGTGAGNLSIANNAIMAGGGYKIGYNHKYFQANLIISHPLKYPNFLEQNIKDDGKTLAFLTLKANW